MEKIKVSPFEYVFIKLAAERDNDNTELNKYEPFTESEVIKQRQDKMWSVLSNIKIKPNE